MTVWPVAAAAILLSVERICYAWAWRSPMAFRIACAGAPLARTGDAVDALRTLFYGFKLLQGGVFVAWCYFYGDGSLWPSAPAAAMLSGVILFVAGQTLNLSVFYRLGAVGVFYGNRFGHDVRRCRMFPFSICEHPQYLGTLLSIWGFFLIMRFPHPDWPVLPLIETVYYALAAYWER